MIFKKSGRWEKKLWKKYKEEKWAVEFVHEAHREEEGLGAMPWRCSWNELVWLTVTVYFTWKSLQLSSIDRIRSIERREKMWVFYMISLPLTMGMVLLTLRYFAGPSVPLYVLFTVGYTWFVSLSIIILVPADIWVVLFLFLSLIPFNST